MSYQMQYLAADITGQKLFIMDQIMVLSITISALYRTEEWAVISENLINIF